MSTIRIIFGSIGIFLALILIFSLISYIIVSNRQKKFREELAKSRKRTNFTRAEILSEITTFKDILERVHPTNIPEFPLSDITPHLDALGESLNTSLTHIEFYRLFAPIVHQLNDDHTTVPIPDFLITQYRQSGGKFFPFEVTIIDEKIYVANISEMIPSVTVGAEIQAIDNISSNNLIETLSKCMWGTDIHQKQYNLQRNFKELLYLVFNLTNEFKVDFFDPLTTSSKSVIVKGRSDFGEETSIPFSYEIIGNDLIFTYTKFDDPKKNYTQFLKKMFLEAKERHVKHLIIDIRENEGGNTMLGDKLLKFLHAEPFLEYREVTQRVSAESKADFLSYGPSALRWIPIQYVHPLLRPLWTTSEGKDTTMKFESIMPKENPLRFTGKISVLTSPRTMSSGSLFSSAIQHFGIGTLIGESPGGYATLYGNIIKLNLPITGLEIQMPTGTIWGTSHGPIIPDKIVKQNHEDLMAGKNSVLEYAKNM